MTRCAGEDGYVEWSTKKFHTKMVRDPLADKDRELFVFDDMRTTVYAEGEAELNLLHLSRTLPDIRGGLRGAGAWHCRGTAVAVQSYIGLTALAFACLAGAVAEHVAAMKKITISSKRTEGGWEKF